jgi:hypothetical protein
MSAEALASNLNTVTLSMQEVSKVVALASNGPLFGAPTILSFPFNSSLTDSTAHALNDQEAIEKGIVYGGLDFLQVNIHHNIMIISYI